MEDVCDMTTRKTHQKDMLPIILKDLGKVTANAIRLELKDRGYGDTLPSQSIAKILKRRDWAKIIKRKSRTHKYKYVGDDIHSHKDKETLEELYCEKDMDIGDIGDELDVHYQTISRWLGKYGLKEDA